MSRLVIRDATEDDRPAIYEITLAAYQEYATIMQGHWARYQQNIIDTLAHPAPAAHIVAEQAGAIVGAVLLFPAGAVRSSADGTVISMPWPEVRLLAVAPATQGQGVGAGLVHECIRRARQSGSAALMLHTTAMMQTAMRMYERIGFVRDTELDFHPAPGITISGYRYPLGEDGETR